MKNIQFKNIILSLALVLLISLPVLAQGAPPATPIDGGLSLLLAAGAAFGAKKVLGRRKG